VKRKADDGCRKRGEVSILMIVLGYGLDDRGFESGQGLGIVLTTV
jgi:hypothetical protein